MRKQMDSEWENSGGASTFSRDSEDRRNGSRNSSGRGRDDNDGRRNFDEKEHPRDASGRFVSDDDDDDRRGRPRNSSNNQDDNDGRRNQSRNSSGGGRDDDDGRRNFDQNEHPRDASGRFISDDEIAGR